MLSCVSKRKTSHNDTLMAMWKAQCRQNETRENSGIVVVEILVKI